jgi:hypothetical protein
MSSQRTESSYGLRSLKHSINDYSRFRCYLFFSYDGDQNDDNDTVLVSLQRFGLL